jgi:N-methylhydantoinase A/oxoprolinase/acetone carboxylase beta subunit
MTGAPDRKPSVILGIDTGGTFTDVTLLDPRSGLVANAKVPSTPADPSPRSLASCTAPPSPPT